MWVMLSIGALVIGPVLFELLRRQRGAMALLDGFVLVTLLGLVVLHLVPHSIEIGGWMAAVAAGVGFALPVVLDGVLHKANTARPSLWILLAILAGLFAHALLDGAALSGYDLSHAAAHNTVGHVHDVRHDASKSVLSLAVVLHRIPLGLLLWWVVRPRVGIKACLVALATIAAATWLGYAGGTEALDGAPLEALAIFQALIAGSLFHVAFHHPPTLPRVDKQVAFFGGIGGLLALAVLYGMDAGHGEHTGESSADVFVTLVFESAPVLLLAFVLAGLVRAFVRPGSLGWLGRGGPLSGATRGTVFGLPLPICSCGVVPLYESLARAGVPATAGVAFLIATPELGLDAVLLSIPLLGAELTIARVVAAVVVALAVGALVGAWIQRHHPATSDAQKSVVLGSRRDRLKAGLQYGLGELVDHTFPWILVGLVVGALLAPSLDLTALSALPAGLDVVIFAVAGLPLYICASGSTPLVAVMVANGLSPGAAIALLLTGPATNLTTFGVLSKLHGVRAAWVFGAGVTGLAVVSGLVTNAVISPDALIAFEHQDIEHRGWLAWASVVALSVLVVASVLRTGPRGLIWGMRPHAADDHHGHDHGHHHHHHDDHDHSHDHGEADCDGRDHDHDH